MRFEKQVHCSHRIALFLCISFFGACSPAGAPDAQSPLDMSYVPKNPLVIARPYNYLAPSNYDPSKAYPLVLLLHGYGATSFFIDSLFKMSDAVDAKQFVYAYPDATKYDNGFSRWNCCGDANGPDDMAYLDAVIADMQSRYHVDPKRIFLAGHSNGAEMTYRYACDRSDKLAAILPVGGTYSTDPMKCAPKEPVSVLHANGDMDPNYPGNPPIRDSLIFWAGIDGCGMTTDTSSPPLDLDSRVPGAETTIEKWPGCKKGTSVELWVIHGAAHHPNFQPTWAPTIIDWFNAHPKQ